MIETTILEYLGRKLDMNVYMEIPEKKPGAFVVIEKTGSSRMNHIESATLAVQSYGPTLVEAAKLNERVKRAMNDAIELSSIGSVRFSTDYNFTDTSLKHYRYQAVYDITYYE